MIFKVYLSKKIRVHGEIGNWLKESVLLLTATSLPSRFITYSMSHCTTNDFRKDRPVQINRRSYLEKTLGALIQTLTQAFV